MAELTAEQIEKAETMPMAELLALGMKEAEEAAKPPVVTPKAADQREEIDNAEEVVAEVAEEEEEKTIYRKEIDNGNGVIEVFQADSLEELVDKIAEGKRNASIKIRELSKQVRVEDTRTAQQITDDEFVVAERLKKEPKKTVAEIVAQVLEDRIAVERKSNEVQSRFVATHPDFIADPDNGTRIAAEVQRLGYTEFTDEGLEKAYQSLKTSGLLKLKQPEASGATEAERAEAERIAQAAREATQPRSSKKSSTISVRNRPAVPPPNVMPSEDEAYSMPMEKLRELANKQLAQANQQ